MLMRWITIVLFTLPGCAMAQSTTAEMPATTEPSIVDQTLDQLDALGDGLRNFVADVSLTETDALVGDSVTRAGKVWYISTDDDALIRIAFDTRQVVDGPAKPEKLEYALKDGWLIERDHRRRVEVNRQVRQPGQKMNLLKLGEGPFPLPIGQDRAEVLRQFDVSYVAPSADDPAGDSTHLRLLPLPDTQFARQFDSIDVWVDPQTHMPRRIETADTGGNTIRTTDLSNIQINAALNESDLALPPIDDREWTRHDEPFAS